MKVMKFGGTSVGSVKSILSLKEIVEAEAGRGPVVVVVSALNGITDKLISTSELAKNGDSHYREEFEAMVTRHYSGRQKAHRLIQQCRPALRPVAEHLLWCVSDSRPE
jgi:aspartokinase